MKTPLAWRNVAHGRIRSLVALGGISFVILLVFMQLGFYAAARNSATQLFDALDFDVLVLSRQYIFLAQPAGFPRSLLEQAEATTGVASTVPVWVELGDWRNAETGEPWNILVLGVEPGLRSFRDSAVNDQIAALKISDNILIDERSRPQHGRLDVGVRSEIGGHRIRIVGRYRIGVGFVAGASAVASRETFQAVFPEASLDRINLGLVKVIPGQSPRAVAAEINRRLWPVAAAFTRADAGAAEQRYWLREKPIGVMFTSGVLVAFLVGAVVLYQVLMSEVQKRLREYATLKALGYGQGYLYRTVFQQALLFATLGYVPAFFLALGLYFLLRTRGLVPVTMEFSSAAGVALLTLLMCLGATALALRKLRTIDPADLF